MIDVDTSLGLQDCSRIDCAELNTHLGLHLVGELSCNLYSSPDNKLEETETIPLTSRNHSKTQCNLTNHSCIVNC